jgi:hypothetical protein
MGVPTKMLMSIIKLYMMHVYSNLPLPSHCIPFQVDQIVIETVVNVLSVLNSPVLCLLKCPSNTVKCFE